MPDFQIYIRTDKCGHMLLLFPFPFWQSIYTVTLLACESQCRQGELLSDSTLCSVRSVAIVSLVQVDILTFCFWKSRCGNKKVATNGKNLLAMHNSDMKSNHKISKYFQKSLHGKH